MRSNRDAVKAMIWDFLSGFWVVCEGGLVLFDAGGKRDLIVRLCEPSWTALPRSPIAFKTRIGVKCDLIQGIRRTDEILYRYGGFRRD